MDIAILYHTGRGDILTTSMDAKSNGQMEKSSREKPDGKTRNISISERGFTYIEMIVSFAMVTSLFPLLFGLYYQIFNSVHSQLGTHQLFHEFDRFSMQLHRDETNAVKIFAFQNKLEMMMKNGLLVRYQWKQGQIVRSLKENSSVSYRGNTILLYHVKQIRYQNLPNATKLTVVLANKNATYTGTAFIWGRIDE